MTRPPALLALAVLALVRPVAAADVPPLVSAQGILRAHAGGLESGAFDMTFTVHDAQTGGTPLHREVQLNVWVESGVFTTTIGRAVPVPAHIFRDRTELWLGVKVEGDAEELPRLPLVTVPYAFQAQHAEAAADATRLGGQPPAAYQRQLAAWPPLNLVGGTLSLATAGCAEGSALKLQDGAWACLPDDRGQYGAGAGLRLDGSTFLLAEGGVDHSHLATNAVHGDTIANQSITDDDIAPGAAISASKLSGVAAASHAHGFGDLPAATARTDSENDFLRTARFTDPALGMEVPGTARVGALALGPGLTTVVRAATGASATSYTLPGGDGQPGGLLATDGTGRLSWSRPHAAQASASDTTLTFTHADEEALLDGMTVSAGVAGRYLVNFSATFRCAAATAATFVLYRDGERVDHTSRSLACAAGVPGVVALHSLETTALEGEVLEVRWRLESESAVTEARTLTLVQVP
jgi:hypothetical protein